MSQREVDNCKCEKTIEKYHRVINEAKKLYGASEKVIDEKVSVEILEALRNLKCALEVYKEADKLYKKADSKLSEVNCHKCSNEEECNCIYKKELEYYDSEKKHLKDIYDLLEEALYKLELSEKARLAGSKFEKEYIKCIFKNDSK